ncbi:helix-turn-helix domain-containing protein [Actinomyces vulturis]|uniref:helix-turn-helix domain-containing protein n=1 Tax=Actinomyces vulturis TaxID=1857645 RepID=UPI00082AAF2E|nr:helix-turn-helix domain-containing protein [Actinomyces vulturis]
MSVNVPALISIKEFAGIVHVTEQTVRNMISRGTIKATRIERSVRIPVEQLAVVGISNPREAVAQYIAAVEVVAR